MSGSGQENTHRTIERVARESYGRLVAFLSSHTHDVGSAEDALSDALIAALATWPRDGVPQNPEAWLLTAARRSFIDLVRHRQVALASEPTLLLLREEREEMTLSVEFPDERLKLLFVCAHPAIDPAMHTPLMLQTVLGLDAARIGGAFLISPKTMGQRLVRAKTKIRDGGIQFEIPQDRELPQRLDAVLEAIYAAFGIGWDDMAGVDQPGRDLAEEAIWLARVLLRLLPEEAEVRVASNGVALNQVGVGSWKLYADAPRRRLHVRVGRRLDIAVVGDHVVPDDRAAPDVRRRKRGRVGAVCA